MNRIARFVNILGQIVISAVKKTKKTKGQDKENKGLLLQYLASNIHKSGNPVDEVLPSLAKLAGRAKNRHSGLLRSQWTLLYSCFVSSIGLDEIT